MFDFLKRTEVLAKIQITSLSDINIADYDVVLEDGEINLANKRVLLEGELPNITEQEITINDFLKKQSKEKFESENFSKLTDEFSELQFGNHISVMLY